MILTRKQKICGIAAIVGLIVLAIVCKGFIGYNSPTQLLVKQSFPSGQLSCITEGGIYWKGWGDIYSYDRTRSFYFNSSTEKVKGKEWEGDDTDEDDIKVTLSRNATADISGYLLYKLPTNCDDLIKIHRDQRNNDNLKHNLVRNAVLSAVRKTAPMYTAEEAKVTKIAEFRRLAEDQLVDGEYLTTTEFLEEKVTDDELDEKGNVKKKGETQKYTVTKLKIDSLGQRVLLKQSALAKYGIIVEQFEIQNVKLDAKSQELLEVVKKREMERVSNATKAETAKQQAITAEANGKAQVAEERAKQEVEKIKAVVQAQKDKEVAELNAEKELRVAEFEARTAVENAKKVKADGEAQAAANRALVQAGLTPLERATIEKETRIGIAEAIAKSPQKWVPEIMIYGGDGKNASNPMDAIGLNMLMDITSKMAK